MLILKKSFTMVILTVHTRMGIFDFLFSRRLWNLECSNTWNMCGRTCTTYDSI